MTCQIKKPEEKSISILIKTHGPSILPLCSATISICLALTKTFIGGALRRYLTVCLMIPRSCRSFQYVPAPSPNQQIHAEERRQLIKLKQLYKLNLSRGRKKKAIPRWACKNRCCTAHLAEGRNGDDRG